MYHQIYVKLLKSKPSKSISFESSWWCEGKYGFVIIIAELQIGWVNNWLWKHAMTSCGTIISKSVVSRTAWRTTISNDESWVRQRPCRPSCPWALLDSLRVKGRAQSSNDWNPTIIVVGIYVGACRALCSYDNFTSIAPMKDLTSVLETSKRALSINYIVFSNDKIYFLCFTTSSTP